MLAPRAPAECVARGPVHVLALLRTHDDNPEPICFRKLGHRFVDGQRPPANDGIREDQSGMSARHEHATKG